MNNRRFYAIIPTSILTILFILVGVDAGATTYYLDSAAGNDAYTGRSQTSPWRNIHKLNTITLLPGDTVLFKRGSFWREQLDITRSGTASAPITYSTYGTGSRPVLCGAERVTGWTIYNASAKIWRASYNWVSPIGPSWSSPDFILINGIPSPKKSSIAACTAERDWYYSGGVFYVNSSTTPTSVEVGTRNYGVFARDYGNIQHIVLEGFDVKSANYKSVMVGYGNHNWIIRDMCLHHNGAPEASDRSGIDIRGCDNMLITGCIVYQAGRNGIQVSAGSYNIIENCDVHDIRNNGISIRGSSSRTCQGNIIRNNVVYQSPSAWTGINGIVVTDDAVYPIRDTKVYGNLIYNVSNIGMMLYGMANTNVEVYNNTVYNAHRCYVLVNMGSSSVTLMNNIGMTTWYGWHPIFSLENTSVTNKTVDYNLWFKVNSDPSTVQNGYTPYTSIGAWRSATGLDAHSIIADPRFVNAWGKDFRIQATSPAVNAGTNVGLSKDLVGVSIPQGPTPDMGAYEYAVSTTNTPPTISISGASYVSVPVGGSYADAGATASDAQDGNLTSVITTTGSVNTSLLGTYYITYAVTDTAGSTTTAVRTVSVVDAVKPVITLLGHSTIPLAVGWSYNDPGATATDNYDGNITSSIVVTGSVNTAVAGTYTIWYNVQDSSGNAATTVTRTVTVSVETPPDTEKPVITLIGSANMTITACGQFIDPGATATDNYDGDITSRIVVTGLVRHGIPGTYYLTYNVKDLAGNAATPVTRKVTVKQTAIAAGTYYVDSASGNDTNNGLSPSSAWRTIDKVNGLALSPGTTILLKRGGFWRNQLNVTRTGTATAPITYGAYGTGPQPIITGSEILTGWTQHDAANSIWKAAYTWNSPIEPSFTTVDLAFVYGEVAVKKTSISQLRAVGDWYYTNGVMYTYSPSIPTHFEVGVRNYGVYACDKLRVKYIVVEDIEIRNANYKSILVGQYNDNWIIRNVTAHRNGRREDVEDGGIGNDRAGINVRNCDNTLITGCTVFLTGSNGIQVTGGSNNIIEKCTVYDVQHHCIDMKGSPYYTCRDNIIRYNTVFQRPQTRNNQHGIVLTDDSSQPITDTKIYGNLVYGIHDIGYLIFGYTNNNVELYNNTCYNCHRDYVLLNMGSNRVIVKNNVGMTTYNNWHPVFSLENTTIANKTVDYNLWIKKGVDNAVVQIGYTPYRDLASWRAATGFDTHSILADPLFVNVGAYDFRLQSNSPAIDKGTYLGIEIDKGGNLVPQGGAPDLGAYEYVSQSAGNAAPSISLMEMATLMAPVGEPFMDPGAVAYDNEDGDLSSEIVVAGTVDTTVLDTYLLEYNVTDSAGASAPAVFRSVRVIDTIQPIITLIGDAEIEIAVDTAYIDSGAVAIDNYDGDISASITTSGEVKTDELGTYTVAYNVSDSSGNPAAEVVRTVHVTPASDTTRPVITLIGSDAMTVPLGSDFTDPGASAVDTVDGDLTSSMVVTGLVDTSITGTYTIIYSVTDSSGNESIPVTRSVTVVDLTRPSITLLGDTVVTAEVGSTYIDAGATANDNYDGDITSNVVASGWVNAALLGTYTITYSVSDAAGNDAMPVERTVNVVDTTSPTITLIGDDVVTLEVGTSHIDPGATATDNYDFDLTPNIITSGIVHTAVLGTYTIAYVVTDSSGNTSDPVMRTVHVVDTIAPTIALLGDPLVTIEVGTAYTDAGATALDNYDRILTSSIVKTGSVNISLPGTYMLTYTVVDSSGNTAIPQTRAVEVVDTTMPSITLLGDSFVIIEVGTSYTDAGATATDNYDGVLTSSITISGEVNSGELGTYTLIYTVVDSSGNAAAPVMRTVEVVDTTAPTVTLLGEPVLMIEVSSGYTDAGAAVVDNYDSDLTARLEKAGTVNPNIVGEYTITYSVADSSGNTAAPVSRVVHVIDSTNPVISLLGNAMESVTQGSDWADPGATAVDNYDGDISSAIAVSGAVDTDVVGTYSLVYTVTDTCGNVADSVTRTVIVTEPPVPTITYYVDSALGSDSNDGLSASRPWRTIAKVNATSLTPGTTVLFKRGGFWRDQLNVTHSGTPAAPITFGAYGEGDAPVFCCSDRVTDWAIHDAAKRVWKAPYAWVSPTLPSFASVDVVYFWGEVGKKKSSIDQLVAEWDWYYADGTLYVYAASAPAHVEVGKRNYGVLAPDNAGVRHIVLQDISIKNANYKSIMVGIGNDNWTIKNITAHRNGRREDIEDGGRSNDRSTIAIRGCSNMLITGCTVYLSGSSGVQITGGSNNIVEHCTIYDTQNSGIHLKASSLRTTDGNVIRYNTIYQRPQTANGMNGIVVSDDGINALRDTSVYGNVLYNISENGVFMYGPKNEGLTVFNNTAYNCHRSYVMNNVQSAATVMNNIGMNTRGGWHPIFSLDSTPSHNKTVNHNLWLKTGTNASVTQNGFTTYQTLTAWNAATGLDAESRQADPLFINAAANDFRLQSASPAIDAGVDMGITTDISGTPIPQGLEPDMGAYETAIQ